MTMESPIRTDGIKTSLKQPEERRRTKNQSRASDYSYGEEEDEQHKETEAELRKPNMTTEDLQTALQKERQHNKRNFDALQTQMTQVKQHLNEATYDIETNHRIGAHLIYKQLQADAKQASQSFTVEGFPKDASPADKHAFIKWILESSSCAGPDVKASLTNTRGEVSNTIVVTFRSGWHRNKTFQWYVDNYPRRKEQLRWWSHSSNRQLSNSIRIRKTLSEDARIRGRYLKAAMACIEEHGRHKIDMQPSWGENAVKDANTGGYLVWCHFSYTNASCQVFVDDSVFETIHKNMDNKIADLYAATGSKGKGRRNSHPSKGKGKGVFTTLDTPFDPRDPFWMKFIRVKSWKNDDQVHAALQDEEEAQKRFAMSDG